jgi:YYY domain-containing protein
MEFWAVLAWLGLCHALAILGLPVATALFEGYPNRGAAFAFPLAALVVTLGTYWIGQVSFGLVAIGGSLVGLLAVDLWLLFRRDVHLQIRAYLGPGLLFTAVFGAVVAIRAVDPAIYAHSGEMFLNFGILKSLERAASLPPQDVWLAGEPVRYYYGGHLLASLLARLTTVPVRYAFNLHTPTLLGALATAGYGLAGAIGASHGVSHRVAGLAGVFFTNVASNVFGAVQLVARALPAPVATDLAGFVNVDPALFTTAQFSYMQGSGFRPHFAPLDFPLFSTFHGGFPPHMMSPPFLLLLGALCFAYYRTPATDQRRRWILLGTTAPVLGFVFFINSWSFPTACGLVMLAVALAPAHPRTLVPGRAPVDEVHESADRLLSFDGGRPGRWLVNELTGVGGGFMLAVALGLAGMAVVAPYTVRPASSLNPGFFPVRSGLAVLVLAHGAFLLVFCWYLWPRVVDRLIGDQGSSETGDRRTRRLAFAIVASILLNLLFLGAVFDVASLTVYLPLVLVGWLLVRRGSLGFEGVLLIAGAGLVVLVDFAYLDDPASIGRYNTVYKAYAQVWLLWSMAAGVALARVLVRGRGDAPFTGPLGFARQLRSTGDWLPDASRLSRLWRPDRRWLRFGAAAALVVSLSAWGGIIATNHFTGTTPLYGPWYSQADDPTLDALGPEGERHPEEMAAILWLDGREGQPTIVEAVGNETFRWEANPASTLTGLPTVAGWKHAFYYHGEDVYWERARDVGTIYSGTDEERTRLLSRYDVRYIYVGPVERERYGDVAFDRQRGISVAFENDAVTIYAVDQDVLDSG